MTATKAKKTTITAQLIPLPFKEHCKFDLNPGCDFKNARQEIYVPRLGKKAICWACLAELEKGDQL